MSYLAFLQGKDPADSPSKMTNYDSYLAQRKDKITIKNQEKQVEVCMPKDFADVEELIDRMRKNSGFVVDFSSSTGDKTQRMVDFLAGAVYALQGRVQRLTDTIYLMTPKGIDIIAKADRKN